jgi:hypothetical protein
MEYNVKERTALLKPLPNGGYWYNPEIYPLPLSFKWRLFHSFNYMCAAILFLLGSMCYFPALENYEWGGWFFTIGSAGFLIADLFEWFTNNRVGCFDSPTLRAQFVAAHGGEGGRAHWINGVNFFYSAMGSLTYFIGSVYFIPELDMMATGTWTFIFGSAIIFTSQTWKLSRYPTEAFTDDAPAVHIDAGAGIGGLWYFIGSIFFLPSMCVSTEDNFRAALLFTLGGASFCWSGVAMVYRYFIVEVPQYPYVSPQAQVLSA